MRFLFLLFYNFNITCKNEFIAVLSVGNFNLIALIDEKNIHTIGHGDVIILTLNLQVVNRVAVIYRSFDVLNFACNSEFLFFLRLFGC